MARELSAATKAIVKVTVPALAAHGTDITAAMYLLLFKNEEVRNLFNQSNQGEGGGQTRALAQAILAYAQNIDNLAVLGPAVERIAQKHVGLQILPHHYPYVADALLAAIKQVLGDAATDEVLAAWGEAYWFLADILIGREKQVYEELSSAEGGWSGWRRFRIAGKQRESDIITSFVLEPEDHEAVVRHLPGQYLTFRIAVPGRGEYRRNYSISSAPNGKTYRISVKREPLGVISNYLHDSVMEGDVLDIAPPAGDFFLKEDTTRPIVLLSGGVGLTPMISMLETMTARDGNASVYYVHGAEDGRVHAMGEHVRKLIFAHEGMRSAIFYRTPHSEDRKGVHYDQEGFVTLEWLSENTPLKEADIYLCGPKPFLAVFVNGLAKAGVPKDRIHYEFFGPADDLAA
ncbi:NO-inducible flavohemoprotein [Rhizobium multihospitium]|uniref:Flavohemoprotein n=1 Tax=Rhizobium multihospitium TaxID=410764 RepID=A0A1C3XCJ4_9HYPH|nr:NO-inducible flavohemoprotein [Rhizobium multihospitium]SCB49836.1 nitric oxide dioxygenase [Rhizobium multihospitium]